jgi:glutamyl-tRNA reductase
LIAVVGVSHRTAPLEVREGLAVPRERVPEVLQRVREECGAGEAMLLSTCNRVEIYASVEEEGLPALSAFLGSLNGQDPARLLPHVALVAGSEAVRHAFRVAASLESMVIGEPQILGQVKEAYDLAEKAGSLGSTLNALRNRSLAAAKRARTQTGIGRNAVSVSHVAVELARKIFGELRDKNVLLVGAGKMSELAARQLVRGGARATVLGGRTLDKAEALAAALGGSALPLSDLRAELAKADIVISGTGAPGLVITREDVEDARRRRSGRHQRPLFLIDIAVPRDIETTVRKISGVFLYDLDDLRSVAEANLRERMKEAAAAEALVDREVREFLDWQRSLDVVPLLVELRQRGDEIRRTEIEKARRRLGPLSAEQEAAIDAITAGIVNKLLHAPTVHLKEIAREGNTDAQVSLIRRLLGL